MNAEHMPLIKKATNYSDLAVLISISNTGDDRADVYISYHKMEKETTEWGLQGALRIHSSWKKTTQGILIIFFFSQIKGIQDFLFEHVVFQRGKCHSDF